MLEGFVGSRVDCIGCLGPQVLDVVVLLLDRLVERVQLLPVSRLELCAKRLYLLTIEAIPLSMVLVTLI